MSGIRCWQVDAFTDHPFGGNPAAIYWLDHDAETSWMQLVAAEMNLSETAFVRRTPPQSVLSQFPLDDKTGTVPHSQRRFPDEPPLAVSRELPLHGNTETRDDLTRPVAQGEELLELRWFTPTMEVDLCGHATLATAHAVWSDELVPRDQPLRFKTRSGILICRLEGNFIELDFPATPATEITPSAALIDALKFIPKFVGNSRFYQLVVVDSEQLVRSMQPDFAKLVQVPTLGVIVSARSDDPRFDFVSRFFAPAMGVDEDPVCGSAHCCLAPYWSERLGKTVLSAYQASQRGGVLKLRVEGDRVVLGGQAVTVWRGECFC